MHYVITPYFRIRETLKRDFVQTNYYVSLISLQRLQIDVNVVLFYIL